MLWFLNFQTVLFCLILDKNELLEAEYFNIIIAMVKSKHEIIVCEALKSLAMFNIPLNAAMIEQISEHCKEHPNAEIRQLAEALK